MEMELKLLLDPASRVAVEGHPAFAGAVRRDARHQVTTYFDTPDFLLHRQGASLRVRQQDGGFVQTVKLARRDDAVGLRSEWEWEVAAAEVDPAKLDALPETAAGLRDVLDRVGPVFVSDIRRDTWLISLDGASEIEAVIDSGLLRAGSRSAPVNEVELELKSGPDAPLFRLALDLVDHADLRYGTRSKAERGYELISDGKAPAPVLQSEGLPGSVTLGQAFPRLVAAALREMAADIASAASGDVEGVHRMRAAIRKLRTLLVLFGPHIDREASRRFNATLRELGTVLGRGRDWDVFLTETLTGAREDLGAAGLDLLGPAAEAQRDLAHAAIAETLAGPVPTRLVLGLGAWTTASTWTDAATVDDPLRDLLPHLLDRLARKVRRRAKNIETLDAEDLHALRKAMKKLRYSAEDVGSLFKPKPVRRYLKAIKSVLSLLGEINDAAVTRTRLDEIAPADRPDLAGPAAALLEWSAARRHKALGKLGGRLHEFAELDPFWS